MRRILLMAAAGALICGSVASAEITTDSLVQHYRAEGYQFIEVTRGRSQIKVEAVKGSQKIEVIYDALTGAILKSEVEAARGTDIGRTGLQLRARDRDFLRDRSGDDDRGRGRGRGGRDDRDDDDDDDNDDDDDDDDDDDRRGSDDD
jgi:hypothetical protein